MILPHRSTFLPEMDFGPDGAAGATPIEELRARYAVAGTLLRKTGITDQDRIDNATRALALARNRLRGTFHGPGEIEGWHAVSLTGHLKTGAHVAGIQRETGLVLAGVISGIAPEDLDDDGRRALCRTVLDRFAAGAAGGDSHYQRIENIGFQGKRVSAYTEDYSFTHRDEASHRQAFATSGEIANLLCEAAALPFEDRVSARFYNLARPAFRHSEVRRTGALKRRMRDALAEDTRHILHSQGIYKHTFVNYLSGFSPGVAPYPDPDRPLRAERRRQAIRAYPVLAPVLSHGTASLSPSSIDDVFIGREKTPGIQECLEDVIDSGQPLAPAIVRKFGLTPAHLRRLQGVTWQKAGSYTRYAADWFLKALAANDPNHIPSTKRGFAAFDTCASAVRAASDLGKPPKQAWAEIGRRFESVADTLGATPPHGVTDLDRYLRQKLVAPALFQEVRQRGLDPEAALRLTHDARTLPSPLRDMKIRPLMEANARWHRALQRLDRDLVEENPEARWTPLKGLVGDPNGLHAIELTSDPDLRREGIAQDHCVGGYGNTVLEGRSLIYSIRDGKRILSTVELKMTEDGSFPVVQHHGRSNTGPAPKDRKA